MENRPKHPLQAIKREFFVYRNGLLADTLRGYGDPHKVIFGLEIPRLTAIARTQTPGMEIASLLWADKEVRESRLLAAYLFPPEEVDFQLALLLAGDVVSREEADILAFRLLKRLSFTRSLLEELRKLGEQGSSSHLLTYNALLPHLTDQP